MLRSTFAFSTFAQFLAVGTNHVLVDAFASCAPGLPETRFSCDVLFGMFPTLTIPAMLALDVKSASQSSAWDLWLVVTGMARSEPPRNAGIVLPATWLGIAKAPITGFSFGLPAFGSSA